MESSASKRNIVPTLHHLHSSQSHRVLWLLEELAEAHGTKYILKSYERTNGQIIPGLKETFPLAKSPILTVEEDGSPSTTIYQLPNHPGTLTESRLIIQYLVNTFSQGEYEPEDATDKAQDIFFQEYANNTLSMKVDFALIFEMIPPQLPFGLRQLVHLMITPVVNYWMADLRPIFQLMEDTLSEERPWFSGKKMGLADFNMSWGMDMASQRKYFEKGKYPKVQAWHERVQEKPAYKRALEKGGYYNLTTFLKDDK